jgi:hypothetical protein
MAAKNGVICASGLIMLLFVGCASDDVRALLALQSDTSGRERVVSGSVDAVAQSAKDSLTQLGLHAEITKQGEVVKVISRSSNGTGFALVLTRQASDKGEQTRVRMEWDGPKEEQLGFQLLGRLETSK